MHLSTANIALFFEFITISSPFFADFIAISQNFRRKVGF